MFTYFLLGGWQAWVRTHSSGWADLNWGRIHSPFPVVHYGAFIADAVWYFSFAFSALAELMVCLVSQCEGSVTMTLCLHSWGDLCHCQARVVDEFHTWVGVRRYPGEQFPGGLLGAPLMFIILVIKILRTSSDGKTGGGLLNNGLCRGHSSPPPPQLFKMKADILGHSTPAWRTSRFWLDMWRWRWRSF